MADHKDVLGYYTDSEPALECGYTVVPSVPWPSVEPGTLPDKKQDYPESDNMDGDE